ncbi:hypothetical protein D9V29_05625 [Mycetocola manganoxydans]|uniref:SRPBCC family protein n=1 Tax=Mycetocola manganoxydans TaxID=699879 RepID=A0A3L6ZV99_9MICO|nr:hypothetical protein [Mycetocola manganoxydans]RLP71916.1 hypothetical protein D9V29_05625 [Mycetocola manganoxydans]GHD47092.1 hypothetical protein GCM10008097_17570 [Mycetocola manganoxydans]
MRVQLKMILDCDPFDAWRALRSPAVLRELYSPLLELDPGGPVPTLWEPGSMDVTVRGAGVVPVGRQRIDLDFDLTRMPGVRILVDSGRPLSGPLSLLDNWKHQMAVAPAPGNPARTLYRDRLDFGGPAAAALWMPMWTMWQWRGVRLKEMAPNWGFDPRPPADKVDAGADVL